MSIYKTVAVIGAGASGMMAAVSAADAGKTVFLIDGNERLGRKLYATGNGRCNFTNINCSPQDYNNPEDGFTETVLSEFTAKDSIDFFENEALFARVENEGRCYPYSGQAAALVTALEAGVRRRGVAVITGNAAIRIEGKEYSHDFGSSGFVVHLASGKALECEAVILACGGRAGLQFGSTGDGYGFAKSFGHSLAEIRPALVAAESTEKDAKLAAMLKGLRAKGRLSLYEDGCLKGAGSGEIQFTGTGVSGICMFDLSRYMDAARPSAKKNKKRKPRTAEQKSRSYELSVDFVPELSEEKLALHLAHFRGKGEHRRSLSEAISGFADRRIASEIASKLEVSEIASKLEAPVFEPAAECVAGGGEPQLVTSDADAISLERKAASRLKDFRISIGSTKGWEAAQVTRGGIRRNEINPETMESLLVPGLYFCGELIDVDGRCGGFNLQWAWASGHIAGKLL